MLDVCTACRIQAPHRPERPSCPRCGRRLIVVDATTRLPVAPMRPAPSAVPAVPPVVPAAAPAGMPPAQIARPPQYPVRQPVPAVRPAPRLRRPSLRWFAHRPPEAVPPAPKPKRSQERSTPRYRDIPRWGLTDVPVKVTEPVRESLLFDRQLRINFRITAAVFLLFALAEIARYVVLVVNRARPIPGWVDTITALAVVVTGLIAIVAVVASAVIATWWLITVRREIYRDVGRLDPRPLWQVVLLMFVPVVNVVGAPVLLTETAAARAGGVAEIDARTVGRLKRLTVAWGVVYVVGLIALIWRIIADRTGLIQTGADAMAWVAVSALVSAAFALWASQRLPRLFAVVSDDGNRREPPRRLVVAR